MKIKNICCIGAGYVGGPTMAVIADKCPDIQIHVVDFNKDRINKWNDIDLDNLPIFEPGLAEIVERRNIWSSELAKLTANAFLAQRISSINAIGALCEATGADVREVSRAIGSDSRIGSKFLDSGPGFGGSCFKKDILNLVYLCEYFGLDEVAKFWESVVTLNNWHQTRISKLITKKLFGTISSKKIIILGFAFKGNTNDTRESAAIQICRDLINEGAYLFIHDPKVTKDQIIKDLEVKPLDQSTEENSLNEKGSWQFITDINESLFNADAIVILTEWEEYKNLDWDLAENRMRKPSWVFDTRSIIDPNSIKQKNFQFWRVGDGS